MGGGLLSSLPMGSWEGVSLAVFNITLIMKYAWSSVCLSHSFHWFSVRTRSSEFLKIGTETRERRELVLCWPPDSSLSFK